MTEAFQMRSQHHREQNVWQRVNSIFQRSRDFSFLIVKELRNSKFVKLDVSYIDYRETKAAQNHIFLVLKTFTETERFYLGREIDGSFGDDFSFLKIAKDSVVAPCGHD